jgi:hypothetical protein
MLTTATQLNKKLANSRSIQDKAHQKRNSSRNNKQLTQDIKRVNDTKN